VAVLCAATRLWVLYPITITNQTKHKKLFESVAKQRFQKVS